MLIRHTKKVLVLLLLALSSITVVGCVSGTVTGHDTANNLAQVDCSGTANSINGCYKKAAKICPDGYTITDNSAPMLPLYGAEGFAAGILEKNRRGITFVCKGTMDKAQVYL